jgi:hypothetical protein
VDEEHKRDERVEEFAPPSIYYEETAAKPETSRRNRTAQQKKFVDELLSSVRSSFDHDEKRSKVTDDADDFCGPKLSEMTTSNKLRRDNSANADGDLHTDNRTDASNAMPYQYQFEAYPPPPSMYDPALNAPWFLLAPPTPLGASAAPAGGTMYSYPPPPLVPPFMGMPLPPTHFLPFWNNASIVPSPDLNPSAATDDQSLVKSEPAVTDNSTLTTADVKSSVESTVKVEEVENISDSNVAISNENTVTPLDNQQYMEPAAPQPAHYSAAPMKPQPKGPKYERVNLSSVPLSLPVPPTAAAGVASSSSSLGCEPQYPSQEEHITWHKRGRGAPSEQQLIRTWFRQFDQGQGQGTIRGPGYRGQRPPQPMPNPGQQASSASLQQQQRLPFPSPYIQNEKKVE